MHATKPSAKDDFPKTDSIHRNGEQAVQVLCECPLEQEQ
jgi:hypothetical protein